jgi:soluble lytic murein transglycosylase-like protein
MDKKTTLCIIAAGLAVLYAADRTGSTLGDKASNAIQDGIDDMNNIIKGWPANSDAYQDIIARASATAGVPTAILAWTLWKESRYKPAIIDGTERSPVGAMGIAQFMPATAREVLGTEAAALDPVKAIPGAAVYLASLYKSLGTWSKALAAYNWGIGNVQKKGIDAAPAETVDYYKTILAKANVSGGNWA